MQWNHGFDTKAARAMQQAVQNHVSARVNEGLYAPRKRELQEMLAEAVRNTARLSTAEESA
jgi:primosomal protein N''